MALFGRTRGVKLIKHFSKEVLEDIIDTPVTIFKPSIVRTNTNLYGEGPDGFKKWRGGIKIYATINREDQEWNSTDFGLDIDQKATFSFLNEHIDDIRSSGGNNEDESFIIDPGDIILYDSQYWEIDSTNRNEYIFGRNEDVATPVSGVGSNAVHGESLSTIAAAHLTRRSKLNIEHPKELRSTGTSGGDAEYQGLYR